MCVPLLMHEEFTVKSFPGVQVPYMVCASGRVTASGLKPMAIGSRKLSPEAQALWGMDTSSG